MKIYIASEVFNIDIDRAFFYLDSPNIFVTNQPLITLAVLFFIRYSS